MKIAVYILPSHKVPPREERILAPWQLTNELVNGLVDRGNDVWLFAPRGSETKAHLEDGGVLPTMQTFGKEHPDVYEDQKQRDALRLFTHMISVMEREHIHIAHIMHDEQYMLPLLSKAPSSLKFVLTLHNPIEGIRKTVTEELGALPNCSLISISDSQRQGVNAPFFRTVYNGVDMEKFSFGDVAQDQYLSAGRIVAEKGHVDAIFACQEKRHLHLVGEVRPTQAAQTYWNTEIKPFVDGKNVIYVPVINHHAMGNEFRSAKAFLFPVHWEEPFGLVMIESMSSGTPVIAYARGSTPEVIKDGVTGFLVNESETQIRGSWITKQVGIPGLAEAMKRLEDMPLDQYQSMRWACREHVKDHFSLETMVSSYEQVYEDVMKKIS